MKYLRELRFKGVSNEPFAEHAWYFRNALVRANFRDPIRGIPKTTDPLVEFFRNILFSEKNPLKNRLLHIRAAELGLVQAEKPNVTEKVTGNVNFQIPVTMRFANSTR